MTKTLFDMVADKIEAVENPENPKVPVDVAAQEAENLYIWCQQDKDLLVKSGLDWAIVESLPTRTGACRYAQAQWQMDYLSLEDVQRQWNDQSPKAYDLRDELVHHFYHAYRNMPDLYAHTQRIAEGSGHPDMIQDLIDLATIGKKYTEPLVDINMDLNLLDLAETRAGEMASLLAQTNGERMNNSQLKVTRDKAYAYLKEAVDEIRHHGHYVFWRNPEREKGYISQYYKKHKKSNKKDKSPE